MLRAKCRNLTFLTFCTKHKNKFFKIICASCKSAGVGCYKGSPACELHYPSCAARAVHQVFCSLCSQNYEKCAIYPCFARLKSLFLKIREASKNLMDRSRGTREISHNSRAESPYSIDAERASWKFLHPPQKISVTTGAVSVYARTCPNSTLKFTRWRVKC